MTRVRLAARLAEDVEDEGRGREDTMALVHGENAC